MGKLTPKETVSAMCHNCLGKSRLFIEELTNCEGNYVKCTLYPYRLGKRISVKTLRKYCFKDCMNGYRELVSDCSTEDCACWPYRFGTNPAYTGNSSRKGIEAMRKWRESMDR